MIEIKNLTKKYGDFTAVDNLSLTVNKGEFYGLLGPNGSGKTTTISMLSTVVLPTSGSISIDGEALDRRANKVKKRLAVVTQEYSMRQDMTVEQIMEYHGRLYYMKKTDIADKTEELLQYAGLWEVRNRKVRNLSGGMKRKLMVCRSLMTEPDILLLDEPTAGMDALSRRQMWNLLRKINDRDITILLTTHYMEEAEQLCDKVALINNGKLDTVGTPEELISNLGIYCIDEQTKESTVSTYFKDRNDAISYLTKLGDRAVMRMTKLEDVVIERNNGNINSTLGKMDRV